MIQAHFTNIKNILLQEIHQAKSNIIIAVAWFTHRTLFNSILEALDRGIDISVIIIDDIINKGEFGLDWNKFLQKGGKLCFAHSRKSFMHNKFCVFDKNLVISGSYNWTYSADKRNSENIIMTDDVNVVKDFIIYFEDLLKELDFIDSYIPSEVSKAEYSEFVRNLKIIEDEINAMKDEVILDNSIYTIFNDLKKNTSIIRMGAIRESNNRSKPILKHNIGMRCIVNGIDNKVLHIINKGKALPYSNTVTTCTAEDYQKSINCDIVYGDSENADENTRLVLFEQSNIPIEKKGKVSFKTKVTLDTNGFLHVEKVCINNGEAKETYGMFPEVVDYGI